MKNTRQNQARAALLGIPGAIATGVGGFVTSLVTAAGGFIATIIAGFTGLLGLGGFMTVLTGGGLIFLALIAITLGLIPVYIENANSRIFFS